MKQVVPYSDIDSGKKEQVTRMFNHIAVRYDALNTFFSMGIDKSWRHQVIRELSNYHPKRIMDLATGTGELALNMIELAPDEIIGIDISKEMLTAGEKKIRKKGLDHIIKLKLGDGENLPVEDAYFDAATIAFGIRNFENPSKGLHEIFRALKPGGVCMILEFSKPEKFPIKQLHTFYTSRIMPFCARVVSNDLQAYRYLPKSVKAFMYGEEMLNTLQNSGFVRTQLTSLSYGIASIYTGIKPK